MVRVWLITGASSGFGRALTDTVLSKGDIVVATHRGIPGTLVDISAKFDRARFLLLQCDVTLIEEIENAFVQTVSEYGRCDVVFNSAGYAILGEIESTPEDAARQMFDVNFWGAANVSRIAIRTFREANPAGTGGRLLQMSSGAGIVGLPAIGYYAASKHALEGLIESLAKELDPVWNIKVSLLEPGSFKTRAHNDSLLKFAAIPPYSKESLPSQRTREFISNGIIRGNVIRAADRIWQFTQLQTPPLHWAIGKEAIAGTKAMISSRTEEIEAFESWAEGLED